MPSSTRICNRLAAGLLAQGIGIGDRVAVLSRNSHAFAALRFALARIGAVLVPINFMLNADEIAFILESSGATVLAVGPDFVDVGQRACAARHRGRAAVLAAGESSPPTARRADRVRRPALGDERQPRRRSSSTARMLAQIVYTSGTESLPKGAMLTHEAVIWEYVSCLVDAEITESDVMLHALPLYHCAQLDVFLGPAIYVGVTNVITSKPTPDNLLPLIARASHHLVLRAADRSGSRCCARRCSTRPTCRACAKATTARPSCRSKCCSRCSGACRKCGCGTSTARPRSRRSRRCSKPEDQLRKAGSAGKPVLNVETRVVDDAHAGRAARRDRRDRAPLASAAVRLLPRPREDRARPSQGGWFHSGDLATIDDEGYITVVDRKKDMIKTGGENVASREVEEMIYRLPEVSEVAVIGLPDPHWIEAVTAVVVLKAGHNLDEQSGDRALPSSVWRSFKVPKRVIFTEALPKNPSGKLLKRELRRRYETGTDDRHSPATSAS